MTSNHLNYDTPTPQRYYFRFDLDEEKSRGLPFEPENDELVPYLYQPLPDILPPGNTDLLLFHAAYHGNIDRYCRLRRPGLHLSRREYSCVIRGIYHNTAFAKFWSMQDRRTTPFTIFRAVNACFIMANDLSRIVDETPEIELPYLIWYPHLPHRSTLSELAQRKPAMIPQIARTCIVGNHQGLFEKLSCMPDRYLLEEAKYCSNGFYEDYLRARAFELNINLEPPRRMGQREPPDNWKSITRGAAKEGRGTVIQKFLSCSDVIVAGEWLYDGGGADMGLVDLSICARDQWKEGMDEWTDIDKIYRELP